MLIFKCPRYKLPKVVKDTQTMPWYNNNGFTNFIWHMMKRILLLLIFCSFSKLDLKLALKDPFWQLLLNFDQPRFPRVKTSLVCGFMVFTFTKLQFYIVLNLYNEMLTFYHLLLLHVTSYLLDLLYSYIHNYYTFDDIKIGISSLIYCRRIIFQDSIIGHKKLVENFEMIFSSITSI